MILLLAVTSLISRMCRSFTPDQGCEELGSNFTANAKKKRFRWLVQAGAFWC
jgi:hypothetical protein